MSFDPKDLLTGGVLSKKNDNKATTALGNVTGAYDGIVPPKLDPVTLQPYTWQGDATSTQVNPGADVQYDPTTGHLADTSLAGPSAMDDVSTDPRLKDQQLASLGALNQLAADGGLNMQDKANLAKIQNESATADRGRQEAILQNADARGMGGSGNAMLAQLASSQAATNRDSQAGLDVAGQAQARALQAMMSGGQLAGSVRGQDFSEAAQKASADDAISRFNAANANQMNQYNSGVQNATDRANSAAKLQAGLSNRNTDLGAAEHNAASADNANRFNVAGRQATANSGVDTANKSTMYNANTVPTQNFQNTMAVANAKSGANKTGVDYYSKQSAQDRDAYGNLIGGAAKLGAGFLAPAAAAAAAPAAPAAAGGAIGGGTAGGGGGALAGGLTSTGSASGDFLGGSTSTGDFLGGAAADAAEGGAHGGFVPGHAKVQGDSLLNDTVPARLSPGEIVVDRATLAHAPKSAMDFLKHVSDHPIGSQSPADKSFDLGAFLKDLQPKKYIHTDANSDDAARMAALAHLAR